MWTAEVAVLFVIRGDELRTLLADSTSLVESLFRTLLEVGPLQLLSHGDHVDVSAMTETGEPSLLDKSFILRRVPLFADLPAEELHLAAIARHVVREPGDGALPIGEPCDMHPALGQRDARPDSEAVAPLTVRAGEAVGLYEMLAGVPAGRLRRPLEHTRALRIQREDFFDLISQDSALPTHLLGALFRELSQVRTVMPNTAAAPAL